MQFYAASDVPMDRISTEKGPLTKTNTVHKYMILALDHFLRLCVSETLKHKKANKIASFIVKDLFLIFSLPREIVFRPMVLTFVIR